ncbi:MAG: hypothetical protein KDC54_14295 [Lewinella sp.]|nr:hypothetical protein [Lewinella sp.]
MRKHFHLLVLFILVGCPLLQAQMTGPNPILFVNKHNGFQPGIGVLPVETDDLIGRLQFRGWVPNDTYYVGAELRSDVTGMVLNDGYFANLQLRTGYPLATRVTVTAEGRVGIGTMLPDYDLHTVGNTHTTGDFYGRIHFDDNQSTDDAPNTYIDEAYFELKQRSVLNLPAGLGSHGGLLSLAPGGSSFDHQLFFAEDGIFTRRLDGDAGSWAGATWYKILTGEDINGTPNRIAKFTGPNSLGDSQLWDDGTNVGIGTDSPNASYLLDIAGDTQAGGNLDVTGATEIGGQLTVNNNAAVTGMVDITGATDIHGPLTVDNDAVVTGDITVNMDAELGGDLDVMGAAHVDGVVSIGTTTTPGGHELYVGGSVIAEEVVVKLQANWPDYVFGDGYPQPDLAEWARFIEQNQHLPGMPSAAEMAERDGVALGEMDRLLLEKVEELTLLLIQQQAQIDALKAELQAHQCPTQK